MTVRCKTCRGTNVQTVEWIDPNTNTVINGDPFSDGTNPAYNWCADCGENCILGEVPEKRLDKNGALCGLNADWISRTWHFGPGPLPNETSGDYYIFDLEDDDNDDSFALVRRYCYHDGLNDEIETVAEGSAEAMLAAVLAILKKEPKG